MLSKIKGLMKTKQNEPQNLTTEMGLINFDVVEEALKAERLLKNAGIKHRLVAPPPSLRRGCDLAVEINLVEQIIIQRLLKEQVYFQGIYPVAGTAELLNIVKVTHFEQHIMIKAGNMKLTFNHQNGIIVNTSGGGCPDIPFLHIKLVGQKLTDAPRPRDIGFTLCALMLDCAMEEALNIWEGGAITCY